MTVERIHPQAGKSVEKRVLSQTASRLINNVSVPTRFVIGNKEAYESNVLNCQELISGEQRLLYNPTDGTLAIRQERRRLEKEPLVKDDDFVFMEPKDREILDRVTLLWSPSPHIERALRQTKHVEDRYQHPNGAIHLRTRNMNRLITIILRSYQHQEVSIDDLDGLYDAVVEEMRHSGIANAKTYLLAQLKKQALAGVRPDSQGRLNYLIAKTHLAASIGDGMEELRHVQVVFNKYDRLNGLLWSERQLERFYLNQAKNIISETFYLRAENGLYQSDDHNVNVAEAMRMVEGARRIYNSLLNPELIKVNPYRRGMLDARYQLFGLRYVDKRDYESYNNNVRSSVGEEYFDYALAHQPPIAALFKANRFDSKKAVSEIRHRAAAVATTLDRTLVVGDQNLHRNSDTEYTCKERLKE